MPALVLWSCVPCLLSALLPCLWWDACKYALIWLFKGVFRGFCGFCVGLCCLGGLRGLWGFCTRVELGGLEACCVFAFLFILFAFRFLSLSLHFVLLSSLLLLSFASPLALSLLSLWFVVGFFVWGCCFLFPYGLYAKRKGAPCWCVLSSCVVCCCYAFANCSRASCHTFLASSGVSPQLFQYWRLAPK